MPHVHLFTVAKLVMMLPVQSSDIVGFLDTKGVGIDLQVKEGSNRCCNV